MINIFLSYSGNDKDTIEAIIDDLELPSDRYRLWHYQQADNNCTSVEEVIKKLPEMDLFVLFVSHDSLESPNVQKELAAAIRLTEEGRIKEICPINIDNNIKPDFDSRIPQCIKSNICQAIPPIKAVQIIENIIQKY